MKILYFLKVALQSFRRHWKNLITLRLHCINTVRHNRSNLHLSVCSRQQQIRQDWDGDIFKSPIQVYPRCMWVISRDNVVQNSSRVLHRPGQVQYHASTEHCYLSQPAQKGIASDRFISVLWSVLHGFAQQYSEKAESKPAKLTRDPCASATSAVLPEETRV